MFLFATQVRAETPARIPVPIQKEWTVLFYFNGKSELETYAIKNFKELETIGSSDNVNFVAELGRMRKQQADDYSNGDWTGIRRYYIEKKPGRLIGSPALETTTKVDMGDWRHLRDFINWGMTNYPARKYMLVVWNHGTGWKSLGKQLVPADKNKGISYDWETGNHITAIEMAKALNVGKKIDVFVNDACYMQDMAVDYEIRNYTDFIVGTPAVMPNGGLNYTHMARELVQRYTMSPEQLSGLLVTGFREKYEKAGKQAFLSVVRTSALDSFANLFKLAIKQSIRPLLRGEAAKYQNYPFAETKDMLHIINILDASNVYISNMPTQLRTVLENNVLIAQVSVPPLKKPAALLALYFPADTYDPQFDALSFTTYTGWGKWLRTNIGR